MSLKGHARAGRLRRAQPVAAGVAVGTAGLALMLGPATATATAASALTTAVGCSAGGLTAAISGAAGGAVLTLESRCRYVLSSGLEATVSLTIRGNGDTITTAASGLPLLTVAPGTTVRLDDLTMSNGAPAIQNGGTLTITDSTFTRNSGGISNLGDTDFQTATLTVKDSAFTGNTATGAIYSDASETGRGGRYEANIIVTGSTFRDNSSSDGGGAIFSGNSEGTLKDDRFTGNTAGTFGGAVANGCRHEGDDVICATLAITGSTFSGNTAPDGGGAISNGATLTVAGSTLTRNAAIGPGNGYGGGLDNEEMATLTSTVITGNTASVDGGGIYNASDLPLALTHTQVRSNTPDNCAPTGTIAGCTG